MPATELQPSTDVTEEDITFCDSVSEPDLVSLRVGDEERSMVDARHVPLGSSTVHHQFETIAERFVSVIKCATSHIIYVLLNSIFICFHFCNCIKI